MSDKRIGKIESVRVGHGGYHDAMFGITFGLASKRDAWGVCDFWGAWSQMVKHSEHCKWTEDDRRATVGDAFLRLDKLLIESKRSTVDQLVGVPVEVEFDGMTLKSWRVLTEAI